MTVKNSTKFWDGPWPKYVRTNTDDGINIYLLPDRKSLTELMVKIATSLHKSWCYFGKEEWYDKTYEQFFQERMNITMKDFVIINAIPCKESSTLGEFKERGNNLRKYYDEYQELLGNLRFIKKMVAGEVDMEMASNIGRLYGILTHYTHNHEPTFTIEDFDKVY